MASWHTYQQYGSWWFRFRGMTHGPYRTQSEAIQALDRQINSTQVST